MGHRPGFERSRAGAHAGARVGATKEGGFTLKTAQGREGFPLKPEKGSPLKKRLLTVIVRAQQ